MQRRVVITGVGIVGSKFNNCSELWNRLINNESSIERLTNIKSDILKVKVGSKIGENQLDLSKLNKRLAVKCDLFSIYSLIAVGEALNDANIDVRAIPSERLGIYIGNNSGGWNAAEAGLVDLHSKGVTNVNPFLASNWFPAAAQGHVSINYKFTGYSKTIAADMASSNISIGNAYKLIKNSKADYMIAGGSENLINNWSLLFYQSSGKLSQNEDEKIAYMPFTNRKSGLVLSDGAAFVILETLESALTRKAHIYAEIIGHGLTNDGVHYGKGNSDGIQYGNAIKLAIGKDTDTVDLVSLNGAADENEDLSEINGLKSVFKNKEITCTCPKVLYGHSFGAAGGMDIVTACLMLKNNIIIKMGDIDKAIDSNNIEFVLSQNRDKNLKNVLVMNKGFGGINAAIFLKKYNNN